MKYMKQLQIPALKTFKETLILQLETIGGDTIGKKYSAFGKG